jgi:hypothetical protein
MIGITYFLPVLISLEGDGFFTYQSMYAHITILASSFLSLYSIFLFKNRKKQLLINQISKFLLSATFFILFFTKGDLLPNKGMFVFIIPYVLILLANRFIKKDEKLVQSADRIR